MNTVDQVLPPMPDEGYREVVQAPVEKKHSFRNGVIVGAVGMFVLLGLIGLAFPELTSDGQAETPVATATVDPVDTGLTIDQATDQAAPLMLEAADELDQITETSAISADIDHMNRSAALMDEAAALFEQVEGSGLANTEAAYLHSAADHMRTAALTWPDNASAREVNASADDLESAREALPA